MLVPIVLGVLLANLLPHKRLTKVCPWASQISLLMLLALNYVNGTVCLPGLVQQPGDFVQPLVAAVVLLGSDRRAVCFVQENSSHLQTRSAPTNSSSSFKSDTIGFDCLGSG